MARTAIAAIATALQAAIGSIFAATRILSLHRNWNAVQGSCVLGSVSPSLAMLQPMRIRTSRVASFGTLVLALLLPAALVACGATASSRTTTALGVELPEQVTSENLPEMLRVYHRLPLDSEARPVLRERILAYYGQDARDSRQLAAMDMDALAERLEAMTDLFTPQELADGSLPAPLTAVAEALVRKGNPRGDEARVLSGLLVLQTQGREGADNEYRLVAEWGEDARRDLPNGMQRYTELIDVWEEHAILTPAPPVLQTLANLHVARRDAVMRALDMGPEMVLQLGSLPAQVRRVAPLDVAAVYLREGQIVGAIDNVRAMGENGETEARLLEVLEVARDDDDDAADALIELAEAYREVKPDVSVGVCRLGLRRFAEDARFPTCLARVAAADRDVDNAIAWYATAIELAPDLRALYDEALTQLDELLEMGTLRQDATSARQLAERTERLLAERQERWPRTSPPISPGRIELLVGAAEMHAGNANEAQRRLEASVAAGETADALMQLGTLELRRGDARAAARHYRRALDLATNRIERAELLEHLGDAFATAGNADQAERMYRQALQIWDQTAAELGQQAEARLLMARLQTRRGVILDHLGDREKALQAFRSAINAEPRLHETYATILSHLVSAEPDLEFAHEVFRMSQRQLSLAPEWKVYFALWVKAIAARAATSPEGDVDTVLREQTNVSGWSGQLARFGAGELEYEQLLEAADGVGESAEAHFYEGVRQMESDQAAARELFQRVLQTEMVSFYEYQMAQALLRVMSQPAATGDGATP